MAARLMFPAEIADEEREAKSTEPMGALPMPTPFTQRLFLVHREPVRRGPYLVRSARKPARRRGEAESFFSAHPNGFYKIAAVGAALLLVFTTC
jgi:hypothetical protein